MSPTVAVLTLLLSTVTLVRGHGAYRQYLPNRGEHVNCDGQEWPAIGHMYPLPQGGPFPRNPFGLEFRQFRVMDEDPNSSYRPQYQTLCQRDSDGDGVSNGQELGDADCDGVLDQNLNNERLGHPGFCEARRGRCGAGASYCPNPQGGRQGSQFGDQFGGAQSQGTNFPQSQFSSFQSQFSGQQQPFPSLQQQLFPQSQPSQSFPQPPRQQTAFQQQPQQRFQQQPQQLFPQQQQQQQQLLFPQQPRQQQAQEQFFFSIPQTQGISPRQRFDQGFLSADPFQSMGAVPWWNWGL